MRALFKDLHAVAAAVAAEALLPILNRTQPILAAFCVPAP
jgi:hypothetical protein